MTNDLISRSALLKEWKNKLSKMSKCIDGAAPVDFRLVVNELENAPAVDAVPVVRCKDCEWSRVVDVDREPKYHCVHMC